MDAGQPAKRRNLFELGSAELPQEAPELEKLRKQGLPEYTQTAFIQKNGTFKLSSVPPRNYRLYTKTLRGHACNWSEVFQVLAGQVKTEAAGRFRMDLGGAGDFTLLVSARGFADKLVHIEYYLPADGRQEIQIDLERGASLVGTVFDHHGIPMPRAGGAQPSRL